MIVTKGKISEVENDFMTFNCCKDGRHGGCCNVMIQNCQGRPSCNLLYCVQFMVSY